MRAGWFVLSPSDTRKFSVPTQSHLAPFFGGLLELDVTGKTGVEDEAAALGKLH